MVLQGSNFKKSITEQLQKYKNSNVSKLKVQPGKKQKQMLRSKVLMQRKTSLENQRRPASQPSGLAKDFLIKVIQKVDFITNSFKDDYWALYMGRQKYRDESGETRNGTITKWDDGSLMTYEDGIYANLHMAG